MVLLFAGAVGVTLVLPGASANATVFDWSYSGGGVSASGTLDATDAGGGVYDVTSITGVRDGVSIAGLTSYAGSDNLVYNPGPYVDYPGLAYTDSSGFAYNVYYDTSLTNSYECGHVGYCEIGPGTPGTTGLWTARRHDHCNRHILPDGGARGVDLDNAGRSFCRACVCGRPARAGAGCGLKTQRRALSR